MHTHTERFENTFGEVVSYIYSKQKMCYHVLHFILGFPNLAAKSLLVSAGSKLLRCRLDPWVKKIPGDGNGNLFQYSCLENPMDIGAWWAMVRRVTNNQT